MDRARKNVCLLTATQALAMTGQIMNVTTSALAGYHLAEDKSLATLAVGLQFTATMAATIPASMLMARIGRRWGFTLGALSQVVGALGAAAAILIGNFWLFSLCGMLFGVANGFATFYRFAAADTADDKFRATAISLVLGGGVAAALVGPEVARWSRDLMLPHLYAGTYALLGGLGILNSLVLAGLDIPKPPRARFTAGRPLIEIAAQPRFLVAVVSAMLAYGTMTLLMTATPLAMMVCGHTFDDSAFVIQWHALGMFAPAFVTGHLIRRLGLPTIMQAGALVLLVGVGIDLWGQAVVYFWVGLILLGVGWNFLFVGATTLLTETYRPDEKAKVQAVNDLCVFSSSATAAFSAGALQHRFGWEIVNYGVVPLILLALVGGLWLRRAVRQPAAA